MSCCVWGSVLGEHETVLISDRYLSKVPVKKQLEIWALGSEQFKKSSEDSGRRRLNINEDVRKKKTDEDRPGNVEKFGE